MVLLVKIFEFLKSVATTTQSYDNSIKSARMVGSTFSKVIQVRR